MSDMVVRVAAKAVILNNKKQVLIVREAPTYDEGSHIGRYGIPGGRLEVGESFNDGLKREVKEETGLEVEVIGPICVGEWRPIIKGVPHQIIAIFMACKPKSTEVTLSNEHDAYEWIDPTRYKEYDLMDPNWDSIMNFVVNLHD